MAPFRFVSDESLGVGGAWWRCGAETSSSLTQRLRTARPELRSSRESTFCSTKVIRKSPSRARCSASGAEEEEGEEEGGEDGGKGSGRGRGRGEEEEEKKKKQKKKKRRKKTRKKTTKKTKNQEGDEAELEDVRRISSRRRIIRRRRVGIRRRRRRRQRR